MAVDIMIVGAPKSGTTSLLAYLGDHAGIQPQREREMTWFGEPEAEDGRFPEERYFGDEPRDGRLRLGKLAGLMYGEAAIERLAALNPEVRAVAILRDPVTRAYSAFLFGRRRGSEPLKRFEDALAARGSGDWWADRFRYQESGHYATYLRLLYERLGRGSVDVLILEEFLADPKASVASLLARVGLDAAPLSAEVPRENRARVARSTRLAGARRSERVGTALQRVLPGSARAKVRGLYRRLNESDARPEPIDPATERELRAHFAPHNAELEALIGRPIEVWRRQAPAPTDAGHPQRAGGG